MKTKSTFIIILLMLLFTGVSKGYELDVHYFDHGLVSVNGKVVTTKKTSYLTDRWSGFPDPENKTFMDNNQAGERIGDYLFKISGNELVVKDMTSGAEKRGKVRDISVLNGSPIFTVLQGYENNFWTEMYEDCMDFVDPVSWFHTNDHKQYISPSYHLLVKNNGNMIDYYTLNIYGAFEKGEDLRLDFVATEPGQSDVGGEIISLIRIPSLDPSVNPKTFCNLDFAVAVYGIKDWRFPSGDVAKIMPFQFHQSENYKNKESINVIYTPYIEDGKTKGSLHKIDSISATTRINLNGAYSLIIGFNCWDKLRKGTHYCGMRMLEFDIDCNNDGIYYLYNQNLLNDLWICRDDTFFLGHYGTVSTYTKGTSSEKAEQMVAFISPGFFNSHSHDVFWVYDISSRAIFDWSKATLNKYGINPKITGKIDKATGEGMVVQGMVLCVPPHPVTSEIEKSSSYVAVNQSVNNYSYEGKSEIFGNKTTIELGGIRALPSMATGGSYEWSGTNTKAESKSMSSGDSYTLQNSDYNMIIGIMPEWDFKTAVLKSKDGLHVRYVNGQVGDNPYVITSAVYKPESSTVSRLSLTMNPGHGRDGEIILTKGMMPYLAADVHSGTLIDICNSLSDLAREGHIKILSRSKGKINSRQNCKTWFDISKEKSFDYSTTSAWTHSMEVGMKDIFSVKNEFSGSITKTSGTRTGDSSGWVFGFTGDVSPKVKGVEMNTVIYQIPVKKLKATFGTRTGKKNLTFIPDYMWDRSMDYWLIAYDNIGNVNLSKE